MPARHSVVYIPTTNPDWMKGIEPLTSDDDVLVGIYEKEIHEHMPELLASAVVELAQKLAVISRSLHEVIITEIQGDQLVCRLAPLHQVMHDEPHSALVREINIPLLSFGEPDNPVQIVSGFLMSIANNPMSTDEEADLADFMLVMVKNILLDEFGIDA